MRGVVDADVIVLISVQLLYWCCDIVSASGGALDPNTHIQTGASSSSHSKTPTFTASLADGLAQVVLHEPSKFLLLTTRYASFLYFFFRSNANAKNHSFLSA